MASDIKLFEVRCIILDEKSKISDIEAATLQKVERTSVLSDLENIAKVLGSDKYKTTVVLNLAVEPESLIPTVIFRKKRGK